MLIFRMIATQIRALSSLGELKDLLRHRQPLGLSKLILVRVALQGRGLGVLRPVCHLLVNLWRSVLHLVSNHLV